MKPISPRAVIGGVAACVLLHSCLIACQPGADYGIQLTFPDEAARALVSEVRLFAMQAEGHACEQMVAGALTEGEVLVHASMQGTVQDIRARQLRRIPAGRALFVAWGLGPAGEKYLAGCSSWTVKAGEDASVLVELLWRCKPSEAGREVPGNGADDDCDGLTDECQGPAECVDRNPCTFDLCDTFACHNASLPNGVACLDENKCTRRDTCLQGECGGTARDCTAFGGLCAVGGCDPATGQCEREPASEDEPCEDGLYCTAADTCTNGTCLGEPAGCDDQNACTRDHCDEVGEGCFHVLQPIPGAEGPIGDMTCGNGIDDDCDGKVDAEDQNCTICATDADCDDANPCTEDVCTLEQCLNTPIMDGAICDDGLYCTTGEDLTNQVCAGGVCVAFFRDCSAANGPCRVGACDEAEDRCVGIPLADGMPCSDGQYCTEGDQCQAGVCVGMATDCDDDDVCTADSCDEILNRCAHVFLAIPGAEGPLEEANCHNGIDDDCDGLTDLEDGSCSGCEDDIDCDDRNPCTTDSCADGECASDPVADGTGCDDGLYCTVQESCQAGVCLGDPNPCGDADDCTRDVCLEQSDRCEHFLQPNPGAEGPAGDATCANGVDDDCDGLTDGVDPQCISCLADTDCDDGNACTADACNAPDCVNDPVVDGTGCEDGLYCTAEDACEAGVCLPGGELDCGLLTGPCESAVCDEAADACRMTPAGDGADCDDGDDCTVDDVCEGGECQGVLIDLDGDTFGPESCGGLDCDDGDPEVNPDGIEQTGVGDTCTDGLDNDCDGLTDAQDCIEPECTPAEACDDGLYCNGLDTCDGTGFCTEHAGNPCGAEICDEWRDACGTDETWYGLSGSDYGLWSIPLNFGSDLGGGVSNSPAGAYEPSLVTWVVDAPVIAWQATGYLLPGGQIHVKRYNPDLDEWVEVGVGSATGGGVSNSTGSARNPSLARNPAGELFLAWSDSDSGNLEIYVKRFDPDGDSWLEVGTGSASAGGVSATVEDSTEPDLAIGADGAPLVAWAENADWIYVKRYDSDLDAWVEVGPGSASGTGVSATDSPAVSPSLAVDSAGIPVVAWTMEEDTFTPDQIYVKRYDPVGETWEEMGPYSASFWGVSNAEFDASSPSLAANSQGQVMLAWIDNLSVTVVQGSVFVKRYDENSNNWVEVGTGSASGLGVGGSDYCLSPAIVLDSQGTPYLAWDAGYDIFIKRFDAGESEWVEVGVGSASDNGISDTGSSGSPALALGPEEQPILAWNNGSYYNTQVYFRRFQDGSWTGLGAFNAAGGGISDTQISSIDASTIVDASGQPAVAWQEELGPTTNEILVRRFNDASGAWEALGGGSVSGEIPDPSTNNDDEPALAVDPSGILACAYPAYHTTGREIHVKRYDPDTDTWVEMGPGAATGPGVSATDGNSVAPALAVDSQGKWTVVWTDDSGGNDAIYAKRYDPDSDAWVEVGAGSASGSGISQSTRNAGSASLAIDPSDRAVVAWSNSVPGSDWEIYVRRFDPDSQTWLEVGTGSATGGGISNAARNSSSPSLCLDENGNPVVAWSDQSEQIFVKRFDPDTTSWVEVGTGSATGGGVSDTAGDSTKPSLTRNATNRLMLAWQDTSSDNGRQAVYVKKFDGNAWVEVGLGSASGRGVSNSIPDSTSPSLFSSPSGRSCLAWSENDGRGIRQIVLRCADTTWED